MFDTYKLNDSGFECTRLFKSALSEAIGKALTLMPDGRDKSIFITKIEEATFFGTRAIASRPENHSDVIDY